MFTKILVPVDGSAQSDAAVDLALGLAAETKASVVFIHAVELSKIAAIAAPSAIDPSLAIDAACAAGQSILDDAKRKAMRAAVPAIAELIEDQCVASVTLAARQHKADLIVLGSHGRGGIKRALLGSVAEGILRQSAIPVLVCHAPASQPPQMTGKFIEHEARVAERSLL